MPLSGISNTLHQISSLILPNAYRNTRLRGLWQEAHSMAMQDMNTVLGPAIQSLNRTSLAQYWFHVASKQMLTAAQQQPADENTMMKVMTDMANELTKMENELNLSSSALAAAMTTVKRIQSEASNDKGQVQLDPTLLLSGAIVGAGQAIGSGLHSFGNSIGHFFTHGSFSHVSASNFNSGIIALERGVDNYLSHLLYLLGQLYSEYQQLESVLTHMEHSVKSASDTLSNFNKQLKSLPAAKVPWEAKYVYSVVSNSLGAVNGMVKSANSL